MSTCHRSHRRAVTNGVSVAMYPLRPTAYLNPRAGKPWASLFFARGGDPRRRHNPRTHRREGQDKWRDSRLRSLACLAQRCEPKPLRRSAAHAVIEQQLRVALLRPPRRMAQQERRGGPADSSRSRRCCCGRWPSETSRRIGQRQTRCSQRRSWQSVLVVDRVAADALAFDDPNQSRPCFNQLPDVG